MLATLRQISGGGYAIQSGTEDEKEEEEGGEEVKAKGLRIQMSRKSKAFLDERTRLRQHARDTGLPSVTLTFDYLDMHFEELSRKLQKLYVQGHEGKTSMLTIAEAGEKQANILNNIDTTIFHRQEEETLARTLNIPFKNITDLSRAVYFDSERLQQYIRGQFPHSLKDTYVQTMMKGLFETNFARRCVYSKPNEHAKSAPTRKILMGKVCLKLPGALLHFFQRRIDENPLLVVNQKRAHRRLRNFFDSGNKKLRIREIARLIRLAIQEEPTKCSEVAALLIINDLLKFKLGINEERPDMDSVEECTNWLERNGASAWRILRGHMNRDSLEEFTYRQIIKKSLSPSVTLASILDNAEKLDANMELEDMDID